VEGMYGAPTDIKIKRISPSNSEMVIYLATFTTLTPAMRERSVFDVELDAIINNVI
jgi:hypothetical protein